jgi:aromatic-amino-acid transaminase
MVCVQAPGGTGALRLAMDLVAHAAPGAVVHLGLPSWPNHAPMLAAAGLRIATYRHYDADAGAFDFSSMCAALAKAAPGDLVLLHGCCHNPSGTDPDAAQWQHLASLIANRGLVPLVDIAYQGLGDGLEGDAAGVRRLLDAVPEVFVAMSCSKSFSLYRERVGMLLVKTADERAAARVRSNLQSLARLNYSNPPDHGAAIVRTILADPRQTLMWRIGLAAMRMPIIAIRETLAQNEKVDLSFIGRHNGLVAMLPIGAEAIETLRRDHAIYMARSGRINLAGLNDANIDRFVAALAATLER